MAVSVTTYPNLTIGSVPSEIAYVKATTPGTTSVDIIVPDMHIITDVANITVLDSGNNVVTSDVDVTVSGNTVTVADGSTFSLADTYKIYLTVIGKRRT